MWRDRTNLFISYRQSYSHHPSKKPRYSAPSNGFGAASAVSEERRGLMSAGAFDDDTNNNDNDNDNSGDAVIEMDLLPPRWLDVQDEVGSQLSAIAAATKALEALHQKHVLPGFDDEAVKAREEREIERLTQDITRRFQSCQKAIKRVDALVRDGGAGAGKADETMAGNLKMALAARVGEASAAFRKRQAAYLKKLRALGGLASPLGRSSTSTPTPTPYAPHLDAETDLHLSQASLRQTAAQQQQRQQQQARLSAGGANDALIAQREREIDDIATGIIELAGIFQELQAMVVDQGSLLDRIDYNVERMAVDVKAADKELTVATGYQRRGVKRKVLLLLVVLVLGMFILLGLKLGRRSSGGGGGGGGGGEGSPPAAPPVLEPLGAAAPPVDGSPALVRRAAAGADVLRGSSSRQRRDWRRRKRRPWAGVRGGLFVL